MKRRAAVALALVLLSLAWPHALAAVAVPVLAVVLGVAGHHLPLIATAAAVRLLVRHTPGLPGLLASLIGRRASRLVIGGAA
jgi:hypothetical protein